MAEIIDLAVARRTKSAQPALLAAAELRRAIRRLDEGAAALLEQGRSLADWVDRLDNQRQSIAAESQRSREIAAHADRLCAAIDIGDIDALVALRAEVERLMRPGDPVSALLAEQRLVSPPPAPCAPRARAE